MVSRGVTNFVFAGHGESGVGVCFQKHWGLFPWGDIDTKRGGGPLEYQWWRFIGRNQKEKCTSKIKRHGLSCLDAGVGPHAQRDCHSNSRVWGVDVGPSRETPLKETCVWS